MEVQCAVVVALQLEAAKCWCSSPFPVFFFKELVALCVSVCEYGWYPSSPEKDVRFPGAGVSAACDPHQVILLAFPAPF